MSFHGNLIKESGTLLQGVQCENSPRNSATVALMDLCYEHASAISLLLEHRKYGSALGLYRSCIEAYIRGVWLLNCASEHDVLEKINTQKKWLSLSVLVTQLTEKEDEFKFLNQYVKGKIKNVLDSFTHGMSRQILHRFDGETIKFRIADEDILFLERCMLFLFISPCNNCRSCKESRRRGQSLRVIQTNAKIRITNDHGFNILFLIR